MKKVLAIAFALASSSFGALIPVLEGVAENGSGGYTYTYRVSLAADQRLDPTPTPRLVLFDFNGYITNSVSIIGGFAGWSASETMMGPVLGPPLEAPAETNEWNLVFECPGCFYQPPAGGDPAVLVFQADSMFPQAAVPQFKPFQAEASKFNQTNPNDASIGTPTTNAGQYETPQNPIPEPATLSLMGGALVGLGLVAMRRRNS